MVKCPACGWSHSSRVGSLTDGSYQGTCQQCETTFQFHVPESSVKLSVNGVWYTVDEKEKGMRLVNFLHTRCAARGTHALCYEGGCGACVVSATYTDPASQQQKTVAVNSCLQPVSSCHGWQVSTSEGIGNSKSGFHPIQQQLADKGGSQCGYCSPGIVMNMYSLLKSKPDASEQDVEDAIDGHICRCTGYRPIIEAMKSVTKDGSHPVTDIEDMKPGGLCPTTGKPCKGSCSQKIPEERSQPIVVALQGSRWQSASDLNELRGLMRMCADKRVKLISGNTSVGLYKADGPYDIFIDIRSIKELAEHSVSDAEVRLGANVSISAMIRIFTEAASRPGFSYLTDLAQLAQKIASKPVRDVAGWAGNLMMKNLHKEFTSDVYLMLATADGTLNIGEMDGTQQEVSISEFLQLDMKHKILLSTSLKPLSSQRQYMRTYKIMSRSQSSLATLGVGIFLHLDDERRVLESPQPRMIIEGWPETNARVIKTAEYVIGKKLDDSEHLQGTLKTLREELRAIDENSPQDYFINLAQAILYKFVLHICRDDVGERLRSGADQITRPLLSAQQTYSTNQDKWPITQPMPKIAAEIQASGEAEYVESMPACEGELYGHFVLTTEGNAKIDQIDVTPAKTMPGVVAVLTHKDIPAGGVNDFMIHAYGPDSEELFCSEDVGYAGQAVALVVAESQFLAMNAARRVKITYKDIKPPITTIEQAIEQKSFFKNLPDTIVGDVEGAFARSAHILSGRLPFGEQSHFYLETQSCRAVPTDDCIEMYSSTQHPSCTLSQVSKVLGIPCNKLHVSTKRVGGAFGGKEARPGQIAAAAALATTITGRPVLVHLPLNVNLEMQSRRPGNVIDYKVGVNDEGKVEGVKFIFYTDHGHADVFGMLAGFLQYFISNIYSCGNWQIVPMNVRTNKPSSAPCRAPGSSEAVFVLETIMEQIAKYLDKDPLQIKRLNFNKKGKSSDVGNVQMDHFNLPTMIDQLTISADFDTRKAEVQAFNESNRWKKRGLAVVPVNHALVWNMFNFSALISIYEYDGSVSVSHGGVEIGQGLITKVVQVCAAHLGIPVSMVTTRPMSSMVGANSATNSGSVSSELTCMSIIEACKMLRARIDPVRAEMGEEVTWPELIAECHKRRIDLQAQHTSFPNTEHLVSYTVGGVACAEVELDVLTGERIIRRADVLTDAGESMNPQLDIGQVEGAFVMGLGLYMHEEVKFDPVTGQCLSASTWDYKPPMPKDIPADFRVALLKDSPNPRGVLGAKGVGEPPLTTACVALFALKNAIEAAREEAGNRDYFTLGSPATVESAHQHCLLDASQFLLQ